MQPKSRLGAVAMQRNGESPGADPACAHLRACGGIVESALAQAGAIGAILHPDRYVLACIGHGVQVDGMLVLRRRSAKPVADASAG